MADALQAAGLYQRVPAAAWKKPFVVDVQPVDDGQSVLAYLAPYVHRVARSDHRIKRVDATSVTYQYKPKKSKSMLTRTVTGDQFVRAFAQHILPTGFRKLRYYGGVTTAALLRLDGQQFQDEAGRVADDCLVCVGLGVLAGDGSRAARETQVFPPNSAAPLAATR